VVAVFSPKGGVGKSFIAATLAAHLATRDLVVRKRRRMMGSDKDRNHLLRNAFVGFLRHGRSATDENDGQPADLEFLRSLTRRVALVDLNLQFGSLDVLLDIKPQHTVVEVAKAVGGVTRYSLEGLLHSKELAGGAHLHVLSAPLHSAEADDIKTEQVTTILTLLRSQFDYTVVDTTSVISDVTLTALQMASDILLICTPDLVTIHQCRAALERLGRSDAHITGAISLVVNRASPQLDVHPEDLRGLFGELPILVEIPSNYRFLEPLVNTGRLVGIPPDSRRQSPMVRAFESLADALLCPHDAEIYRQPNRTTRGGSL
jgi:pilus assembly protein CpaE